MDKIKKIIAQDKSMPKAPINEWTKIKDTIISKKNSIFSFINLFKLSGVLAVLILSLIFFSDLEQNFKTPLNIAQDKQNNHKITDSNIKLAEYILDSKETEPLYVWIDEIY